MKAIQKIKNGLIRLLGGITKEQLVVYWNLYYSKGMSRAYYEMLEEARKQYGKPSEEWCKTMYDHIAQRHDFNYGLTQIWQREATKSN